MIDKRIREPMAIRRIVRIFGEPTVSGLDHLVGSCDAQPVLYRKAATVLKKTPGEDCGFLVDFGRELYGGIRITTGNTSHRKPVRVRIRFGESVSEALEGGTNDHTINDMETLLPWLGSSEWGRTGFRFVRMDLLDDHSFLELQGFCALAVYHDVPWVGSFESSDALLNEIWKTAVYTVQLSMQEYIWDGIKRDNLVWAGDLHPEVMVIGSVFGNLPLVRDTLDFLKEGCPLPGWMNGISSYTLWWIIIHRDWYRTMGDLDYLKRQRSYLKALIPQLVGAVGTCGSENLPPMRFLDWPSQGDESALHAGLHALLYMALGALAYLFEVLNESDSCAQCRVLENRVRQWVPGVTVAKQAAALMAISGLADAELINRTILAKDPYRGISTFYGYYVLEARGLAGDYQGALNLLREYWGGMLRFGATTFWEGFDLAWTKNAAPIDEIIPADRDDLHAGFGEHCYRGLRHSLCHGWAGGPAAWLIHHILGLRVINLDGGQVAANPQLCDLEWAKGSLFTPHGPVSIECRRRKDGSVEKSVKTPKEIQVIRVEAGC